MIIISVLFENGDVEVFDIEDFEPGITMGEVRDAIFACGPVTDIRGYVLSPK